MDEDLYDEVVNYPGSAIGCEGEIPEEVAGTRTAQHFHIDETFVDQTQILLR